MKSQQHGTKTVVITGGNRGIGLAAAQRLAEQDHRVILVCRDEGRGRDALASLPDLPGDPGHHLVIADLASLASVGAGARAITDLGFPLAALLNNAAVLPARRMLSPDGFEMQLAVTHLGHFLLTNLLLPLLTRRPHTSRVITVSSGAHAGPPFDFRDPNFDARPYRRTQAYQQSKLANVLFTLALARRTADTGIEPLALHPGVYDTALLKDYMGTVPGSRLVAGVLGRNPARAGPILADLAVGRRDEDLSGAYLDKSTVDTPSKAALDMEDQEKLWAWSAAAVGIRNDGATGATGLR